MRTALRGSRPQPESVLAAAVLPPDGQPVQAPYHVLADARPVLEPVAGTASDQPRVLPGRVPVDQEVAVGRRLVLAATPRRAMRKPASGSKRPNAATLGSTTGQRAAISPGFRRSTGIPSDRRLASESASQLDSEAENHRTPDRWTRRTPHSSSNRSQWRGARRAQRA